MKIETTILEILWRGPFTLNELKDNKINNPEYIKDLFNQAEFPNYGLYQIYGTHPVFGPNSLLYIGRTKQRNFRMLEHEIGWIQYEYDDVTVYVGVLGAAPDYTISHDEYQNRLSLAERILIYMCQPPYNSQSKAQFNHVKDEKKSTSVFNFGRKAQLPTELSTYYHDSLVWDSPTSWQPYKIKESQVDTSSTK